MKKDIFISHSSLDNEPKEYCRRLEAAGLKCWIAPRDIKPGQTYQQGILDGIEQCSTMLVFISSNALDRSNEIGKEVTLAEYDGKRIIPVFIENVRLRGQLKYDLINKQWIEAWGGIEQGIRELERAFGISVHVDSTINHPKPIEPQHQFSSKPAPLTKEQLYNVRLVLVGPNKIGLVAKIKQLLGVELSRAKHLVDNAPITLVQGVSENESSKIITEIRAIGGHATAIKVTDFNKTEQLYRVKLVSIGANKLRLIKRVYETLAINLAKAKTIVDSAPCTLIEGLNASECYNLIKQIKDAGGDARSERM